jgi:hypothetical protein
MARPVATCGECGKLAGPVMGSAIFDNRRDMDDKIFFLCVCGAYCGSHQGSGTPLGKPAGPKTRLARRNAHYDFDRIWKGGLMGRNEAYAWLAARLGIDPFHCHIGLMDRATALRVTRIAQEYWRDLSDKQIAAARAHEAKGGRAAYRKGKDPSLKDRKSRMSRLRQDARNRSPRYRTRRPDGEDVPFP